MKRLLTLLLSIMVLVCGCEKHITDADKYGKVASYIDVPAYFPEIIDGYIVNAYSYTLYSYMDVCYEIFLDITVTKEEFAALIDGAKESSDYTENEAYYAQGYYEIVFCDDYSICTWEDNMKANVGDGEIRKVIYNPQTHNIVFECFSAIDYGVYPLEEVAYFNRFGIEQEEYVKQISE